MINQIIEQMYTIEENIKHTHNDQILFLMNKKYRELQDQLAKEVKNLSVKYQLVTDGKTSAGVTYTQDATSPVTWAGASTYVSPYDYNCPSCGHEFDFCDGAVYSMGKEFVLCPMCGEIVDDEPCV